MSVNDGAPDNNLDKGRQIGLQSVFRKTIKFLPITILIVFAVIFVYSLLFNVKLGVVLNIGSIFIVLTSLVIVLSPLISSLRMYLLARLLGIKSFKDAFVTRSASNFIALVTPGATGAQFVKAYWIERNGEGWAKGLGLANVDTLFDVIFVNVIVLSLAIKSISQGYIAYIPVLLVSMNAIGYYLILFSASMVPQIRSSVIYFFGKLGFKIDEESVENFSYVLRELYKHPGVLVLCVIVTFFFIIIQSLTIVVIGSAFSLSIGLLDGLIFISVIQVMGGSPTPGGAIMVEYGASLLYHPDIVITWRVVVFTLSITYYFIFFLFFMLKHLGKQDLKKGEGSIE